MLGRLARSLIVCSSLAALAACSDGLLDADTLSPVNSAIGSQTSRTGPVSAWIGDTTMQVGDTIRLGILAVNRRTRRDVTKELRFTYTSSDSVVAHVSSTGLVTARAPGTATVTVGSTLGSAAVDVKVSGPPAPVFDSIAMGNLPARPDSLLMPPVPPDSSADAEALRTLPSFSIPFLPAASVNVSVPSITGRSIRVAANDAAALSAALSSAVGGDEIVLPNGSEYVGNFMLPKHTGAGVVVLRSETVSTLPGTRVTPTSAGSFARIVTQNVAPAIKAEEGSSGWRLIGLQVRVAAPATDNYGIVVIGPGTEPTMAQLVSNIVLDRVFITAGELSTSRCVALNGNSLAVVNSWLADCHAKGRDTQGIGGWTGVGPFLIENNHIEGAGQAIMFGGADPKIADVTPSDITIRRNHLFKPLSWGNGKWTVKATFELKHARRVLFEGNVLENHWMDAQVGYAVLMQAANQDGTAPWSKIWDVTFRDNTIRNSTSGLNILSRTNIEGRTSNDPMRRVLFQNNLFVDVGRDPISGWNSGSNFVQLLGDHEDVSLLQNTIVPPSGVTANAAVMFDGSPSKRLTMSNNVFGTTSYGIFGTGSSEGTTTLNKYSPGATVTGDAIAGRIASLYPAGNSYPATIGAADFVAPAAGDYTLRSSLPYAMSGGSRVGVNGLRLVDLEKAAVTR